MPIGLFTCVVLLVSASAAQERVPLETLVDVGGHRLHFVVHRGTEPVTIVLESGGGATLESWGGLDTQLARRTGATVVAYDRAGFGRSDVGPRELTPSDQIHHLDAALEGLGVPSRRIVVGQSYGGLMAVLHASAYGAEVDGLVLLDPMNSRFVDATGDFVYSTVPAIAEPANDQERAIARMVRTFDGLVDLARAAEPGLRMPMVVITASRSPWNREAEDRAWRASHEAIAAAAGERRLVVAEDSGHQVAVDRPDVVIEAVVSLLRSIRGADATT